MAVEGNAAVTASRDSLNQEALEAATKAAYAYDHSRSTGRWEKENEMRKEHWRNSVAVSILTYMDRAK